MTADMTLLGTMTVRGRADQVRVARRFARDVIGADDPRTDTVVLLVSEMVTNSVVHSRSGQEGGTVTVTITETLGGVRVEVADDGGPGVPALRWSGGIAAEDGMGLLLLEAMTEKWGYRNDDGHMVTWFELSAA
jgi:anti-sigma regulatory factor (Ser/Thr protein kinase)